MRNPKFQIAYLMAGQFYELMYRNNQIKILEMKEWEYYCFKNYLLNTPKEFI